MKKTIKYLFAAIALIAAASCQKEAQPQNNDEPQSGTRVLTVTFEEDEATKAILDGNTPKWEVGDKIMLFSLTNDVYFTDPAYNEYFQEVEISEIVGNSATITTTLTGLIGAIYPSSVAVSSVSGMITYNVPSATNGSFKKAHIAAAKQILEGDPLVFRNLSSILKIAGKLSSIYKIAVSGAGIGGQPCVQTSSIKVGDTPVIEPDTGVQTITVSEIVGTGPYYVAVVPQSSNVSITFSFKDSGDNVIGSRTTSSNAPQRGKIYNIGYALDGVLPGVFSVSNTKTVHFSKGNLYWDGSKFEFEGYQYLYASDWDASHVSHFYWSKTASVAYASSYSDTGDASDVLFTNATATTPKSDFTAGGATGVWRALSTGEWGYLISDRIVNGGKEEGKSFQRATVNSVYGLILYPDGYTAQTSATSYDSATWTTMETAGCVFLPAARHRYYETGVVKFGGDNSCMYWSSSAVDAGSAKGSIFQSGFCGTEVESQRDYGFSIRLVTE